MFYYLKGKIVLINKDSVVIDVNNIGYEVFVTHSELYKIDEETTIYTAQIVREDEQYLAGFRTLEEKEVFNKLCTVKGIGPRSALNAMSGTTASDLIMAISANNTTFLKKLPGIGAKAAQQIILDLKGQLTGTSKGNPDQYDEVRDALQALGFKNKQIDDALASINVIDATNEEIMRLALKKINEMKKRK